MFFAGSKAGVVEYHCVLIGETGAFHRCSKWSNGNRFDDHMRFTRESFTG
jgi:hypothetical protein